MEALQRARRSSSRFSPHTGSLPAGVYQAAIAVQVGSMPLTVNVVFVVVPSVTPATGSSSTAHATTAASCTATKLYPVFTSLTQGFVIPASWPLPIQLQVVDDCGNPMTSGQVATDFSNGDPRLVAGVSADWAMAGYLAWTQPESEPNRDYRQRGYRLCRHFTGRPNSQACWRRIRMSRP